MSVGILALLAALPIVSHLCFYGGIPLARDQSHAPGLCDHPAPGPVHLENSRQLDCSLHPERRGHRL